MSLRRNPNAEIRVWKRAMAGVGLASVLSIAGCAVGPKYNRPAVEVPPAYKEVGDWKPAQPNEQNLGGAWWQIFQDQQLNALEDQINVSNQNLKAAEAQYTQTRAVLRYYRADYYPSITAGEAATRNRISNNRPPGHLSSNGATYNDYQIPVQLSYELDVWGRVRKTVESQREQAQASAADLATVNLSLHAQLALFYFQARSLDAQEQLLNSTVAQYEQAFQLTDTRFKGGLASEVEVQQASTQLETTRAQAIDVGVQRSQYEHAIATLVGTPAPSFAIPAAVATSSLPLIPVGLPSDLLQRRPDVASAERSMAAANARIGVARGAYYPSIILGAGFGEPNAGWQSTALASLFAAPSRLWSLGLTATQTLFDAGKTRANVRIAGADYTAAVATYRQTVLTAMEEVENGITGLASLDRAVTQADASVKSAQEAFDIATARYKGGVDTYLEMITAQQVLLGNQRQAVQVRGQQFATAVYLVKALGGSWSGNSSRLSRTN